MSSFRTIASLTQQVNYHKKLLQSIRDELDKAENYEYASQREDAPINDKVLDVIDSMVNAGLSDDCQD